MYVYTHTYELPIDIIIFVCHTTRPKQTMELKDCLSLLSNMDANNDTNDADDLTQPLIDHSNSSHSSKSSGSSLESVSLAPPASKASSGLFAPEEAQTVGTTVVTEEKVVVDVAVGGVYNDAEEGMTYARRLALSWMQYDWYYPKKMKDYHKQHNVSLDAGWEYFEHQTLFRHKKKVSSADDDNDDDGLDKADPGEHRFPTQLYGYWSTPGDQLGDFGIGIGVYFSTTWWLGVVLLLAGVISLSNTVYLSSNDYTDQDAYVNDVNFLQKASAICSDQVFVPCPDCSESDWDDDNALNRYALSDTGLSFAKHNECEGAESRLGYVTVVTIVFLIGALKALGWYQEKVEVAFDEDEQTAQDYSLTVDDAPEDALDPEEWRQFFTEASGGGHVTAVTVSIDNGKLVNKLVQHRLTMTKLKTVLHREWDNTSYLSNPSDLPSDFKPLVDSTPHTPWYNKYLMIDDARTLYKEYMELEEMIGVLCDKDYSVTDVFVTFETEKAQRTALTNLSVGQLAIINQDQSALPGGLKFRGNVLLNVCEPAEPSAVRWHDIATHWKKRVKGLIISTILTLLALFVACFIVLWRADEGDTSVALYIATMNCIFPLLCRSIVNKEVHPDEGDRALSLYVKITLFRWINTSIIIFAATPFTHSLSDSENDLIPRIYTIFFAELITAPLLTVIDAMGIWQRHILAPRAKSQDEINSLMRGTIYEVAERYTSVTKLLFLCFFYAALYPMGFFMCALALFSTYMADKLAVLRIWRPAPMIGNEVAEFQREYFFTFSMLALVIVNGYLYAMFPYDNLCETSESAGLDYVGTYNITKLEEDDGPTVIEVTVKATDPAYDFCNQNIFTSGYFPPRSDVQDDGDWMTSQQEGVVDMIGWFGFCVFLLVCCLQFLWKAYDYIMSYFQSSYDPCGDDQNIPYSSVPSISAYVPQVRTDNLNFPLLACSIDDIDRGLIGFTDPYNDHQVWSLMRDFPTNELREKSKDQTKPILSIVKHYPPPKQSDD